MLYSILVGDIQGVTNEWNLVTDEYNATYLENNSIRQRIKVGKNVKKTFDKVSEGVTLDSETKISQYKFAENTFISNNNRNMNLNLLNFWVNDEEVMKSHKEDNIIYVTLSSNFKVLDYKFFGNEIVQTYHTKDCKGMAIKFHDIDDTNIIGYISTYDINDKKIKLLSLKVDRKKELELPILTVSDTKSDIEKLNDMYGDIISGDRRDKRFLLDIKDIPTHVFITNSYLSSKLKDNLDKKGLKDYLIITIGKKGLKDKAVFTESLLNNRIRAITTVGVKITPAFMKEYKILYLFNYDLRHDDIKCIKSK